MGKTGKKKPQHAARTARGGPFSAWQALSFFVAGLLIAGGGQLALRAMQQAKAGGASVATDQRLTPAPLERRDPGSPKPWGDLEITPLVLERPVEMFDVPHEPASRIGWLFPEHSLEQLEALFQSCELTDTQKTSLLDTNRWQPIVKGWRVFPPMDLVRDLSESSRERIYSVLGRSSENPQFFPFTCREDRFKEIVDGCELSAEKIALLRRLCYRKGGLLYFADGQYFELTSSSNETRCMFRTLLRVPTMLVKLRVTPSTDIDTLVEYWGVGGRSLEIKPLLQSLARVPGGGSVNLSYLLPPVPRLHLYTYPPPTNGARQDCFWTSFNFFGERPDYRLGDVRYADALLHSDYARSRGEKRFGDLLVLIENNMALHACIYIAEDIYYTKNGTDPNQPWVLMQMKDIISQYPAGGSQEWRVYRKNAT